MRLSDIMSAMNLDVYPQVALVIFLGVFCLVVLRVLSRRSREEAGRFAMLALEEGTPHAAGSNLRSPPARTLPEGSHP